MANRLNELNDGQMDEGLETHVVAKQIPVTVGGGSLFFEIVLWVLGIIPGLVFLIMKIRAKNYFQQLEQKIQQNASQIDNYLEQRVVVLKNTSALLDKAIDLDKSVFENIARYRSGLLTDEERNNAETVMDGVARDIRMTMENYPELKAHGEIEKAMKQNSYLQMEITAARELYNDTVNQWNRSLFQWPTKQIVAAREGYTTRIPFTASNEIRSEAKGVFF